MDYRDQDGGQESVPGQVWTVLLLCLKKPVIREAYQELRYSKIYDQGDTRVEHDPENLDFLEGVEDLNFTEGGIEEGDDVKVRELYGRLPEGFEQVFTDEEGNERTYPEKAGIIVEKVVLEGNTRSRVTIKYCLNNSLSFHVQLL